ncbi:MAG TPA: ATP-binding protein, partial [Candidatus Woesearchaeota archaeon]|nr:ATP-binding protein [Candidatus Woesearchaeota archaeon]
MKAFHTIAVPHKDILDDNLDMNVWAADIWEVFKGRGTDEYKDADRFFTKTYETIGLQNLLQVVGNRCSGKSGDPVIQLQTPFGGGKTHSLIAMFHKAEEWKTKKVVLAGTAMSSKETLWGNLEKQLTGKIKDFADNVAPGKEALRKLLKKHQPVLILMDEVLEYATKAATVKVGDSYLSAQTIAFMQELTEVVGTLPNVSLVLTLPTSIVEHYDESAERLFGQLQKVIGRKEKIYTPVLESEITKVIRKRLFSSINKKEMKKSVKEFLKYAEEESLLPSGIEQSEYRKRFEDSYPFLPEVVDVLYHRWGSFPRFQRTRGVLRILSLVVYSTLRNNKDLPYISLADFDLSYPELKHELLTHLTPEFISVVGSDITDATAGAIKANQELGGSQRNENFGVRVATTIFMYSHSGGVEQGATMSEIKL